MPIPAEPRLAQARRYNWPVVPEIALFRPDMEPDTDATMRDIILRVRGQRPQLKIISEYNAAYDPLHFVLLFPRGEAGWWPAIPTSRVRGALPSSSADALLSVGADPTPPKRGSPRVTLREYLALRQQPNTPHTSGLRTPFPLPVVRVEQHVLLFTSFSPSHMTLPMYVFSASPTQRTPRSSFLKNVCFVSSVACCCSTSWKGAAPSGATTCTAPAPYSKNG